MYHIRSSISSEERYRDLTARAWHSLFLCAAGGAAALACAWLTPNPHTGKSAPKSATDITLWEQETAPPPPTPAPALQLPPAAVPEIAFPEPQAAPPAPVEEGLACPPPLAVESGEGSNLFPTPETLGSRPRPMRRPPAAPSAAAPAATLAATTPPAYRETPEPPYPAAMREERAEGSVRVRICVDAVGTPTRVDILQSSGHRELDITARDWILRRWHFFPARSQGKAIAGIVATSIRFVLE